MRNPRISSVRWRGSPVSKVALRRAVAEKATASKRKRILENLPEPSQRPPHVVVLVELLEALRRTCHAFLEQASTRRALLRPARQKALKTLDSYVAMCAALLPFDRVPSTEFEAFRAALADAEAALEPDPMPSE